MRHLITGGTGFVGSNLIPYLKKEGHEIDSLSIRYGNKIPHFETDTVIHLSGKAHDLKHVNASDEYYQANTELTKEVFDLFLASSAKVFITLSSVKAVADSITGVLTEQTIPIPRTHYGRSKLLAEQYIFSKPLPDGKRVYVLRPCMIHGPGNKGNLNLLYKLVNRGIPYPLAAFENRRSFLSVENLCFAIREIILRNNIQPGVYNIADDVPLSTSEVIRIMSRELSRNGRLLNIPRPFIKWIAWVGDRLHLPLNSERLKKLTEDYMVSNKKIKSALQAPFPVSSEEGLRTTIRSFKQKIK